jgi:acetyl-CoA acetyltransferase
VAVTVAIVGAAESDLGVTGRSILGLQAQAITRALADAGLRLADIDGIATAGVSRFSATQVADYLGIRPAWTDSSFAGGSAFEMYVARAAQAIESGQCTTVLISYGSNQRSARSRSLAGAVDAHVPEAQFEAPYGPLYPISYYAMAAQRYLHVFGATREQLAEVAIAAREWAMLNPAAFSHGKGPLTVTGVLAAPMVSTPLTTADCCLVTDGGGAVIMTSVERAKTLKKPPIYVLGCGQSITHATISFMPDLTVTGAVESGRQAYAMAGMRAKDIDVVELYDAFTLNPILFLEDLGFCAKGEGGPFISGGRIAPGGALPVNTNGGGLSYCHPGMYGLFLLIEAVRQLRGEGGQRQVAECETAIVHGNGGVLSAQSTVILGTQATL